MRSEVRSLLRAFVYVVAPTYDILICILFIVWPNWLNWIEHQTSNLGVAGSSPALGVVVLLLLLRFDFMGV